MCDDEVVHEYGATLEEEMTRQDIYEHHKKVQPALATTKVVTVVAQAAVVTVGDVIDDECDDAGGEGDPAAAAVAGVVLYDVLTHFHSL